MKQRSILFLYMAMMASVVWAAPKPKPQLYVPMDYSTCGYRASEQAIPDVKNVVYVDKAEECFGDETGEKRGYPHRGGNLFSG